jgi:predicted dehydrogenase
LVIGYGSIGARHCRLAAELGAEVSCVSTHRAAAVPPFAHFSSVAQALAQSEPGHIVIANATASHARTLQELAQAGFSGRVLVEKPLTHTLEAMPDPDTALPFHVSVAYNLRFHPLIQALHQALEARPLYSAAFHAGQYLPQWRPGTDYRASYSARQDQGGGVLRDLSHEIDLAIRLCGRPRSIAAIGGHVSELDIDSDDLYSILSRHDRCPAVTISVNYLEQTPKRVITINARDLSASADLVNNTLTLNGETRHYDTGRDTTYRAQLQAFFDGELSTLCRFDEGHDVVRFIAAAQTASAQQRWVPFPPSQLQTIDTIRCAQSPNS